MLKKNKSMVFRNGVIKQNGEKFQLDGNVIDNVSHYKYLDLPISTRLSWTPCQKYLAKQANRAALSLSSTLHQ